MKGFTFRTFLVINAALAVACSYAISQESVEAELRSSIETVIRMETDLTYEECPGFLVGIIDNNASYTFAFGHSTLEGPDTLTSTDVFEIGSVTKPVVATLVALLIEDDVLSLDQSVNSLLPADYRNANLDDLVLRDLLTHNSGFPRYPAMFGDYQKDPRDPYASFTKDQLLEFYHDFRREGVEFVYSHVNYALIEIIIEYRTGEPFQSVLERRLLQPLAMNDSGICEHGPMTPGFDLGGNPTDLWTFQAFAGSEGLKSSLRDMLSFLRFSLRQSPSIVFENYSTTNLEKRIHMALGWYLVRQRRNIEVFAHSGYTTGYYCFAGIVPSTQTGVVILANSSSGVEDLGFELLRLVNFNWKRKSNG